MNLDRIARSWFKISFSIFDEEHNDYCKPCSSYFDERIFSWQKLACKFYPLTNNWMIATGKKLLDILLKIKLDIDKLTHKYFTIGGIIKELLCACYFNNI